MVTVIFMMIRVRSRHSLSSVEELSMLVTSTRPARTRVTVITFYFVELLFDSNVVILPEKRSAAQCRVF
jgi:hypothetical protein